MFYIHHKLAPVCDGSGLIFVQRPLPVVLQRLLEGYVAITHCWLDPSQATGVSLSLVIPGHKDHGCANLLIIGIRPTVALH
jgi:hypothetical protein